MGECIEVGHAGDVSRGISGGGSTLRQAGHQPKINNAALQNDRLGKDRPECHPYP